LRYGEEESRCEAEEEGSQEEEVTRMFRVARSQSRPGAWLHHNRPLTWFVFSAENFTSATSAPNQEVSEQRSLKASLPRRKLSFFMGLIFGVGTLKSNGKRKTFIVGDSPAD
jgi:hypothetical protein